MIKKLIELARKGGEVVFLREKLESLESRIALLEAQKADLKEKLLVADNEKITLKLQNDQLQRENEKLCAEKTALEEKAKQLERQAGQAVSVQSVPRRPRTLGW
jgi:regulator of replication initiation timing